MLDDAWWHLMMLDLRCLETSMNKQTDGWTTLTLESLCDWNYPISNSLLQTASNQMKYYSSRPDLRKYDFLDLDICNNFPSACSLTSHSVSYLCQNLSVFTFLLHVSKIYRQQAATALGRHKTHVWELYLDMMESIVVRMTIASWLKLDNISYNFSTDLGWKLDFDFCDRMIIEHVWTSLEPLRNKNCLI